LQPQPLRPVPLPWCHRLGLRTLCSGRSLGRWPGDIVIKKTPIAHRFFAGYIMDPQAVSLAQQRDDELYQEAEGMCISSERREGVQKHPKSFTTTENVCLNCACKRACLFIS